MKVTAVRGLEGNPRTPAEIYLLTELETFLNPADNTICYQKKWYRIGENTIENIYPPENSIHGWITRKIKPAASSMYRDLWRS